MPFQGYKLDDSFTRTEPGRPRLPQGYFRAQIVAVRPTPKDYDRTPGYNVDFKIVEGPTSAPGAGVGRTISRYNSMGGKEGSQFGMAGTMGAAGQGDVAKALRADPRYNNVQTWELHAQIGKFIETKIAGKFVVLTVVDEVSQQGRPFSSVLEVQADDNWDTLKGTPLIGGSGPSAPGGVPASPNGPTNPPMSMAEAVAGMFEDVGEPAAAG